MEPDREKMLEDRSEEGYRWMQELMDVEGMMEKRIDF